jgi:hypothetical protein
MTKYESSDRDTTAERMNPIIFATRLRGYNTQDQVVVKLRWMMFMNLKIFLLKDTMWGGIMCSEIWR